MVNFCRRDHSRFDPNNDQLPTDVCHEIESEETVKTITIVGALHSDAWKVPESLEASNANHRMLVSELYRRGIRGGDNFAYAMAVKFGFGEVN